MKTTSIVLAVVASAFCFGCPSTPPVTPDSMGADAGTAAAAPEIVGRRILHKKDIPEFPGKEGVVYVSSLPVNGSSGRHSHPGPELSYLISGKVHVSQEANPDLSRDVSAGETLSSATGAIHDIKNIGNESAKIVTYIIIDKGAQLAVPAPDKKDEPKKDEKKDEPKK